jgi:hypothetical protein
VLIISEIIVYCGNKEKRRYLPADQHLKGCGSITVPHGSNAVYRLQRQGIKNARCIQANIIASLYVDRCKYSNFFIIINYF